mmetsp:Transcript_13371/g.19510  ORF Transcript_13371/g.19510 Transcript_13371/m.19510 type:complete len:129 (+) Transcript_13371:1-387(+)
MKLSTKLLMMVDSDERFLSEKDPTTNLYPFMLAAVGKRRSDLTTINYLLRCNPNALISVVGPDRVITKVACTRKVTPSIKTGTPVIKTVTHSIKTGTPSIKTDTPSIKTVARSTRTVTLPKKVTFKLG